MAENTTETGTGQASLSLERPGDKLRLAREAAGLSLADVAGKTRVPLRHLAALEAHDYAALPGPTYCIGFSRAYARAVGVDEVAIAAEVRRELESSDAITPRAYEAFEPADPARVPPRILAWTAAAIALLIAIGYGVWRTEFYTAPTDSELADTQNATMAVSPQTPPPATAAVATGGPVVLTAMETVWVRIFDATNKTLLQRELAQGESYTVPADANNPMILTGRPASLSVTVGGKPVAPLGPPDRSVSDLPISAQALLARASAGAAALEPTSSNSVASPQANRPQSSNARPSSNGTPPRREPQRDPARETPPASPAPVVPPPASPAEAAPDTNSAPPGE